MVIFEADWTSRWLCAVDDNLRSLAMEDGRERHHTDSLSQESNSYLGLVVSLLGQHGILHR